MEKTISVELFPRYPNGDAYFSFLFEGGIWSVEFTFRGIFGGDMFRIIHLKGDMFCIILDIYT